jgi:hypothetical protein
VSDDTELETSNTVAENASEGLDVDWALGDFDVEAALKDADEAPPEDPPAKKPIRRKRTSKTKASKSIARKKKKKSDLRRTAPQPAAQLLAIAGDELTAESLAEDTAAAEGDRKIEVEQLASSTRSARASRTGRADMSLLDGLSDRALMLALAKVLLANGLTSVEEIVTLSSDATDDAVA